MHRADGSCHWCGELKSPWQFAGATWHRAAAVAVMLVGAGTVWRVAPTVAQYTTVVARDARPVPAPPRRLVSAPTSEAIGPDAANALTLPTRVDSASAVVASVADDSITWTPAVARTWVNVRADASRGGEVVGVLKPTTRAMLGADRAGWRLVKSPDVQGWVDPRLFEPDSLRTRGE